MAFVIEKSNGRFQVRWEIGDTSNGGRRRGSRTFATRSEADVFCCFVHPLRHREVAEKDIETGMRAWITWRLDAGFINAKTAERQINIAENFGRTLGKKKLIHITSEDMMRCQVTLKDTGGAAGRPLAMRTIRQHLSVGKKFCAHLVKGSMIAVNPFDALDMPRSPIERVCAPAEDMVEKLLALARRSLSCGGCLWLVIVLISQTGLRRGEALALRWSDLDIAKSCLSISRTLMQTRAGVTEKPPKTEAGVRMVHLEDWVVALLLEHRTHQKRLRAAAHIDAHGDDLIFSDEFGAPLRPDRVSGMVAHLKREAGWPKRAKGLHGLRHRFASLLCGGTLPIRDVAQALGHADASFTLRTYVHAVKEVVRTTGMIPRPGGANPQTT